jgi:hypothetical protein
MKKLFTMAALVAAVSVSAEVTPRAPIVPWGASAEIIITNDLTQQNSDGSWTLTSDAQKWIEYSYDGSTEAGTIQQTNRANLWYDIYDENTELAADGITQKCDTMITTGAEKNWGGYITVTNKAGSTSGLMVVGKDRYPAFYVTGTDKAKFYFSGSASTAGYPQIEVYEVGSETPVITKTGDIALTKKTWDKSTLLIADGLDKAKSYKIVARTMALVDEAFTYEGGDIVLQAVKFYGEQSPLREDGFIISGSEIGSYINAHLAQYPDVTDFYLEGSGRYTIKEGIVASGKFTLTGDAAAPATIDASALAAPFVAMNATQPEAWVTIEAIKLANVKVAGLGQALFSSATKNYLFTNFTVDNCVIEVSKDVTVFDFTKGSAAENFTILNSTLYATTTTTKSLYSSQSGQKVTEAGDEYTQTFTFNNNTIFNFAKTKNFFTHRQSNQKWLTFNVKNNIFMDCGKQGQVIKGMNGGQGGANPTWAIDGNTFLWSQETTVEETTTVEIINTGDAEETGDADEPVQNNITGVPFSSVPTNDFTVAASSLQAKNKNGDPRWLVPYATDAIKIEVDLTDNTDWVAALNTALEQSEQPSSIEISFWEAGEYPTTGEVKTTAPIRFLSGSDINAGEATIVVNNGMTLGGSIEFNGVNLKAAEELAAPMITLAGNEYKLQDNGFYNMGAIKFLNMSIKNGSQQILYGNKINNQISELLVENSVVDLNGSTKVPFDFQGGGAIGAFNIKKSTIWSATATTQSLFSTQSGNKATEAGYTTQNFAIDNSMLYNIATGKNFYTHRQNSQKWESYYLRNSIIVDCGKQGQFIKGMNGGGSSANPNWVVSGNAIFFTVDGVLTDQSANESTGDDDQPAQNAIAGTIEFTDLAAGDFNATFTLAEGVEEPTNLGDPRWTITYPAEVVNVSGDVTYALVEGDSFTSGQIVDVTLDDDVVATIQYGEPGADYAAFAAAVADANAAAWGYTASTGGNGVNGNKPGGTFYTIVPKYDGVVAACVVLNKDKAFHLTVDGEQNAVFDGNTVSEKYYGPVEFNVKAGKAYKFYCDGSKLGFYGFNYKFGPEVAPITEVSIAEQTTTGIKSIQTAANNGVIYNINGQRVNTMSKGLYIQNGRKYIVK